MPSRDFFGYSAEFLPLAASGTGTVRVTIQSDSDFLLAMITGDVRNLDADEAAIADPAILVNLVDEATGRQLFDRAQLWNNIVGTAERPFPLPVPRTLKANGVLQVTLTNSTAATKRVRMSFLGYKVFP